MTASLDINTESRSPIAFYARMLAPLAWAGAILWLSLTSNPPQIPGVLGWDKLLHAGAYGLLSALLAQFLLCVYGRSSSKAWWYAGFAAVCFGALLEILQLLAQSGRTAEWWDLFADAVGAFLACVVFRQIVFVYSRHHGHPGE